MAKRRVSYAWALKADARRTLPGSAGEGLRYARLLAKNALEWRRQAPRGGPRPFPLTAAELAREEDVSASTVRRRIEDARYALFGALSDSGIYYVLDRARNESEDVPALCAAPDCENALPTRRTRRRVYCLPSCRRRHHYQRQHPGAKPAPHLRGPRKHRDGRAAKQLRQVDAFLRGFGDDPERAIRLAADGGYRESEPA